MWEKGKIKQIDLEEKKIKQGSKDKENEGDQENNNNNKKQE